MPTLLNDHLVQDSLSALYEWTGGPERISRTMTCRDSAFVDELVRLVGITADSMDHHPVVDRTPDGAGVTFTLWTHSAGGVTELDIALASRIDDLAGTLEGAPPTPAPGSGGVIDLSKSDRAAAVHQPLETVAKGAGTGAGQGGAKGGDAGDDGGVDSKRGLQDVTSRSRITR